MRQSRNTAALALQIGIRWSSKRRMSFRLHSFDPHRLAVGLLIVASAAVCALEWQFPLLQAESEFRNALTVAHSQQASLPAVRATTALRRL
ncbi:MAG: hypothetical protein ACREXP_02290 [Steroidobacteraceae bacterium]